MPAQQTEMRAGPWVSRAVLIAASPASSDETSHSTARPPISAAAVKARYKELVKRHHPDANGGDKASEEKFKQITQAYETIMDSLAT